MNRRPTFPLVVLVSFSVVLVGRSTAFAAVKCQNFVKYQASGLKFAGLTFPKDIAVGEISSDAKTLQVATEMVQIFDAQQYATCNFLRGLTPGSSKYEEEVQKSLNATRRLAELMAAIVAYKSNPAEGKKELAKLVESSTPDAQKAAESSPAKAKLEASLREAGPEIAKTLDALKAPKPTRPWAAVPKEKREKILSELGKIAGMLSRPLGIDIDDLTTLIFMSGGDGRLYVPEEPVLGTHGTRPMTELKATRIVVGYGFTGMAYSDGEAKIGEVPAPDVEVKFSLAKNAEAKRQRDNARMYLIEEESLQLSTTAWVMALPIKNAQGTVIAVLSVSSREKPASGKTLEDIYYEKTGEFRTITDGIASLLHIPAASAAHMAEER
jgi:hypothetical protein